MIPLVFAVAVTCGEPPCGNNNTMVLEMCNTVKDNCTTEYVCLSGYAFPDGTISRTINCKLEANDTHRTGRWSDLDGECERMWLI